MAGRKVGDGSGAFTISDFGFTIYDFSSFIPISKIANPNFKTQNPKPKMATQVISSSAYPQLCWHY
jgi:hypothetical protein